MQQPPKTLVFSRGAPPRPPVSLVPRLQQLLVHPQPGPGGRWVWALSTSCACTGSLLLPSTCLVLTAPNPNSGRSTSGFPPYSPECHHQGPAQPGLQLIKDLQQDVGITGKPGSGSTGAEGQGLALGLPSPPLWARPLPPSRQGPGKAEPLGPSWGLAGLWKWMTKASSIMEPRPSLAERQD